MSEAMLFEWNHSEKKTDPGDVERAYLEQMKHLAELKVMTPAHAGIRALVLKTARAVDEISASDAASGRAQLLKALNDVAMQLPQPPAAEVTVIDKLLELFQIDSDEPGPYDEAPHE